MLVWYFRSPPDTFGIQAARIATRRDADAAIALGTWTGLRIRVDRRDAAVAALRPEVSVRSWPFVSPGHGLVYDRLYEPSCRL